MGLFEPQVFKQPPLPPDQSLGRCKAGKQIMENRSNVKSEYGRRLETKQSKPPAVTEMLLDTFPKGCKNAPVRSGIRTHASIRRQNALGKVDTLKSGALDHSAILTRW